MRVKIEFDLDVADFNDDHIHDFMADWTYEIRASRYLRPGSWHIQYNVSDRS